MPPYWTVKELQSSKMQHLRAMLCIREAYDVARCLSACLSRSCTPILSKQINIIYLQNFSPSVSHVILVFFHTKRYGNILTGAPLTGASNAVGIGKHCAARSVSRFIACCQRCDRVRCHQHGAAVMTRGGVCWWREATTKCLWQEASMLSRRQQNSI